VTVTKGEKDSAIHPHAAGKPAAKRGEPTMTTTRPSNSEHSTNVKMNKRLREFEWWLEQLFTIPLGGKNKEEWWIAIHHGLLTVVTRDEFEKLWKEFEPIQKTIWDGIGEN
jgi:hypothetical protein